MTLWKFVAFGAFGRPSLGTVDVPAGTSATAARDAILLHVERMPERPSLAGVRLAAGGPWINAGQFRGREAAEIVAMILTPAILDRPDWLIVCPPNGPYFAMHGSVEASSRPLSIASRGAVNAHLRFAAEAGARWARANRKV